MIKYILLLLIVITLEFSYIMDLREHCEFLHKRCEESNNRYWDHIMNMKV